MNEETPREKTTCMMRETKRDKTTMFIFIAGWLTNKLETPVHAGKFSCLYESAFK